MKLPAKQLYSRLWSRGSRLRVEATLHFIQVTICGCEQSFDCVSVVRANGYPDAYRKGWLFSIIDESI